MHPPIRIYKSGLHFGEEPIICGNERSGMISFSGCMLACRFCYTPETSRLKLGQVYSPDDFSKLLMDLTGKSAKNINLITPSHLWSEIENPLSKFKELTNQSIPIVLKIGGYESPKLLKRMANIADIWVTDFKIWDTHLATQECLPKDYGSRTLMGIELIHHQIRQSLNHENKIRRGVLVRHLLMPGFESDSHKILENLAEISFKGPVNLMTRFIDPKSQTILTYPEESLNRLTSAANLLGINVLIDGKVRNQCLKKVIQL